MLEFGSFAHVEAPEYLGLPREKFDETIRRDHWRKEVVDALHRGGFLFRFLTGTGVADDDRQIPGIARRPRITLDAPIEMDTGQHDRLDSLAAQLERELCSCKSGLKRKFVELIITWLGQRAVLADEFAVLPFHLRRKVQEVSYLSDRAP